jgi:hypothetical protein
VIEWELDSDLAGIRRRYRHHGSRWQGVEGTLVRGFELAPVEMKNSEQTKGGSRTLRVELLYVGPHLWDVWVDAWRQLGHRED